MMTGGVASSTCSQTEELLAVMRILITGEVGFIGTNLAVALGLYEHGIRTNLRSWATRMLTGVVVVLPYVIAGRFLSMVLGVLSINKFSIYLSAQAMNLWWPVQCSSNAVELMSNEGLDLWLALAGHDVRIFEDFPISRFAAMAHFDPALVGIELVAVFTGVNLWVLWLAVRGQRSNRAWIFGAAGLQVYGYFILIPLFTVAMALRSLPVRQYVVVCLVFFLQDLVFYGFGRDFNPGTRLLTIFDLAWLTVPLACVNVALFLGLFRSMAQAVWPWPGLSGRQRAFRLARHTAA